MKLYILIIIISYFSSSCCVEQNYLKSFNRYETAADQLTKHKGSLSKYEGRFNKSKDDFILLVGEEEFGEIVKREGSKDMESILLLWKDGLIDDDKDSLWFLKNGNIYFQLSKCQYGYNYLVYDGGEEIEIDVSDDNIKERIKPNWIYIRMRE